jgi:F-type H+-transporting ATPase subunit epsilon
LRIRRGTQTTRYFVDGGFAQVRSNVVTVLTAKAIKPEEIDVAAAKKSLEEALKSVGGDKAQAAARKAQDRARAQIRLAAQTPRSSGSAQT